jgi:hypothetical protein
MSPNQLDKFAEKTMERNEFCDLEIDQRQKENVGDPPNKLRVK